MKIYLMTDLEGVSGVYRWENREDDSRENHERRCRQRRWLAEEVNAAVEGFFAGGATEVIVNDGHGAGYTIDFDAIDPRVTVIHGEQRPFWLPFLDSSCAATGIVGAHAKAGTPHACLCHTMSGAVRGYWINGICVGEMGLQAFIAGHYGVPFVFCSGDAHACREIEELVPGCVTVSVKEGLSLHSARAVPPRRAQEMIRAGAEEAMRRIASIKPLVAATPVRFREERYAPSFDEENPPPHSRVIDSHTREIEAEDIIDLMNKLYGYPRNWQPLS
jgi:D-amino peptidase